MKTTLILAVAVAAAFPGAALANEKLAQEKQCFGCHALKEEGVGGPSFQKIARYWKPRKDGEAMMVKAILQGSTAAGGQPHWNKAKMPDQAERPLISEAEARLMAKWILTL